MNPADPTKEILETILETIDVAVFAFDKERKVLFSNPATKTAGIFPNQPGEKFGSAEENHFKDNQYYDENGNLLVYPNGSAVDLALKGVTTKNLLLEHRNKKTHTQRWISVSCVPINNSEGNFEYGVLWYSDVTMRKSREDRLKFLVASTKILSITMDFEKRLQEKAKLFVPSLADWCSVELVNEDGTTRRVALVHRDPKKLEWIEEYQKNHPTPAGRETAVQRVIRTNKAEFTPLLTKEMIDNAPMLSDEEKEDIKKLELSSMISVPISIGSKVLGVLTLAYAESGRIYHETDCEFFQEFAHNLSALLENARLYNEISRRDTSKDTFLASLSHELRNPLAPIRTSLELLRLKNPDISFREDIDIITHQFGHITRLLNDLLDSTRFTRGKINIHLEPTEFIRIIEQVVKGMRPLFEKSDIQLHLAYPSKQLHMSADRTRLEQALTNMLSNAVKFTPAGGSIWIDVTESKGEITISIKDTGVGITKEEMDHIFDPYYQGVHQKNGNVGLGIGLFLVQQIITLHGGKISVKSDGIDQGSEFIMSFPIVEPDYKPKPNASMPDVGESSIRKILVVDDNQAAADSLSRLLNALGWQTIAVYSGEQALSFLEKDKVDLIFLDIGMPGMTGYELVRILKEHDRHSKIPVVAVTGYGLEDDKIKAIQAGFSAHITKPIGARDLREILTGDIVA